MFLLFFLIVWVLCIRTYVLEREQDLGPAISYYPKTPAKVLEKSQTQHSLLPGVNTQSPDGKRLGNVPDTENGQLSVRPVEGR